MYDARLRLCLGALTAVLAACSGLGTLGSTGPAAAEAEADATVPVVSAAQAPPVAAASDSNALPLPDGNAWPLTGLRRVIDTAFADPAVLVDGNTFWAYGTNDNAINIQVAQSDDLVQWSSPQEALPALPAWANPAFGHVWAPDVFKTQQGKYIMYFSARHATAAKQCVGVAVASSPAGPFVSQAAAPLVCQLSLGGTIDASSYVADGRRYLLYKNDGNCCGIPTSIYARPLAADGLGFTGPEMPLIKRDLAWEGSLIEGPSAIVHDKAVMLMYSANNWHSVQYAVGLAQSTSPSGPFTKRQKPWIVSGDGDLIGPGGQASFTVPGHGDYMALHGWDSKAMKYRAMYIAPVIWTADGPSLRY